MSDAKHTPGPWEIENPKDGADGEDFVIACQGAPIAHVLGFDHFPCVDITDPEETAPIVYRALADAHLIAAAPDLLAACESFLMAPVALTPAHVRTHEMIKAAVAKAKGA